MALSTAQKVGIVAAGLVSLSGLPKLAENTAFADESLPPITQVERDDAKVSGQSAGTSEMKDKDAEHWRGVASLSLCINGLLLWNLARKIGRED